MRWTGPAVAAAFLILSWGTPSAQAGDRLVGTWRLVSASGTASDGHQNNAPFGLKPKGILIYTREGTMTAVISHDGRKPLSVADRISAPLEERAEAYATFFAYAGRYTDSGEKVIHHVEVSSVQNWVNTDLIRLVRKEGARIILTTPPTSAGGTKQTFELVWERVELDK